MRQAIRHLLFPGTLFVALAATRMILARGTPPEAVIVLWFVLMPWVAFLERALPRHPEWNLGHDDGLTDAIYLPASLLVAGGLSSLWGGFHLVLASALQEAVGSPVWPSGWTAFAQVALACVVAELFAYWPHRWMHEVPWLWRFHAIHHSARRVYWLNALRAHPGEHVFRGFISSIPLAVLGAPPEILAYWMVISRVAGLFQHANIDFALGPFAWIFSIGELHRWHHSRSRREADRNYGDTFIFWDAVFGTRFLPRGVAAPRAVGLADPASFPTGWWRQQLAPFERALWTGPFPQARDPERDPAGARRGA